MAIRWTLLLAVVMVASNLAQGQIVAPAIPSVEGAFTRFAKLAEPDLQGDSERLPQYVELFRTKYANDTRLFAFDVEARLGEEGRVRLSGYVEFPEIRNGLEKFLKRLGFEIDNQIETLPEAKLGERVFGLVKTAHTLSYNRPEEPRNVETDCLLGEPLYLLRQEGDYLLVHSGEGYLGYVASDDVLRVGAEQFDRYVGGEQLRMTADHRVSDDLTLPVGAVLKCVPTEGGAARCLLPTGETVEVPSDKFHRMTPPTDTIDQAIARGKRFMGTPYHWGGKTAGGIDCSGLVQVAFASVGRYLPRDANQQHYLGRLTATRWHRSSLRRGDTLYFVGSLGRIRHTALYLGDGRYLHAELPVVAVGSFNPEHDEYQPRRDASFVFAKRLWE